MPLDEQVIRTLTEEAGERHGVDPVVLRAIILQESRNEPRARSPRGALGLMQVRPKTARAMGVEGDLLDPAVNVEAGAKYFRSLLEQFGGDLRLALAAYNAGPTAVRRYGGVPPYPETQRYVFDVLQRVYPGPMAPQPVPTPTPPPALAAPAPTPGPVPVPLDASRRGVRLVVRRRGDIPPRMPWPLAGKLVLAMRRVHRRMHPPPLFENPDTPMILQLWGVRSRHEGVRHGLPVASGSAVVTSGFGYRLHPIWKRTLLHRGIDIAAPEGSPVLAWQDGVVLVAESRGSYGNVVLLAHANGLQSLYAHLEIINVRRGWVVRKDDIIGTVGRTGRVTGPHLHFEVRRGREWLDPLAL